MPLENFRGQDYIKIKKLLQKTGELFEDPEFPAAPKSLFFSKNDNTIEWMRPKELAKVPKLIVEGVTCDDLNPGELGNNWFVAACASLAQEMKIWQKVFPDHKEQEFDDKNPYVGMFKFNFYRYGHWIEVVIDDRLPARAGKLVFCHSKSRNEFWSALLEKAYAKMFGDYESLQKGYAVDALVDFTGGVAERLVISRFDLEDQTTVKSLMEKLVDACDNGSLIITVIECPDEDRGDDGDSGLVLGQGYTMTGAKILEIPKTLQGSVGQAEVNLVRLFNPWEAKEWTGAWSDSSPEWKRLPPSEWEKLGLKFRQDGEFWMSVEDFTNNFTHVDMCHFVNTSFFSIKKAWVESIWHSQWHAAGRTGGCVYETVEEVSTNREALENDFDFYKRKFIFKFLYNPQYMFDIVQPQEKIMLTLEQHDVKGREAMLGNMNTIGYHLMKVEENRKFRCHIPGERIFSSDFEELRSVYGDVILKKGRYVVIACTKNTGGVGHFMVRLYTASNPLPRELTEEAPTQKCPLLFGRFRSVSTIKVLRCEDLALPLGSKATMDPYLIIKCEGEKVTSPPQSNTLKPVFNVSATFYRKKPADAIFIELWNHNNFMHDFLGEARCESEGTEIGETRELRLYGRGKERAQTKPGKMFVFLRRSNDLTLL